MKKLLFVLVFLFSFHCLVYGQLPKEGLWKGTITYSNATIPFGFEVEYPDESEIPVLTFINGEDRASLNTTVRNDSLIVPMFAFDITLKMALGEEMMEGTLTKHYSNKSYPFKGEYGLSRYTNPKEKDPLTVGNRWDMTINVGKSSEYPAVGLFEQEGNRLTGTIMTEVSDYRFFEGKVEGNNIELSIFDGVHAFLLRGSYDETKKQWRGELVLDDGYVRPWTASRDDRAELPDPFEIVDLSNKNIRPDLGQLAALSDQTVRPEMYKGKVLILQLMGTWCSNSRDQTHYLTNWLKENGNRNVEILAVNYEVNYSRDYGLQRIETYKERLDVPYDIILGGPMSKTRAAEAFSFMDKIMAFPTLVFIDKEGYARYIHSYFTGPATGPYYEEFDRRFNAIVDKLTEE